MNTKRFYTVFWLLLLLILILGSSPEATLVRAGEDVFVAENESLTEDLALFASTISVDGYVDSDVIAFSRSITISGVINQDLMGGAESIDLTGQVGDDIRVGGRYVDIRGPVGDDAIALCQRFTLSQSGRIGGEVRVWCSEAYFHGDVNGNLRAGCDRAEIHGHVGGNASVRAGNIKIDGAIDGDAELKAETIVLLPECIIDGDLTYASVNDIEIQTGAQVRGQIERLEYEMPAKRRIPDRELLEGLSTIWIFFKIAFFFGQIIIGLILVGVFRKQSTLMASTFLGHIWKSLGIGFVFVCCASVASLILPFTAIGLPLAIMLICFSLIIWYLSPIVVSLALGGQMVGAFKEHRTGRMVGGMILGLFILRALSFIPILGLLIQIFVILAGMGAILLSMRSSRGHAPGGGSAGH
jgi:cytoskeletal protein CcmA (bactofilin family)